MTHSLRGRPFALPDLSKIEIPPILIVRLLLLGGCLNGLAVDMGTSWQEEGVGGIFHLFGIGFFSPIIIGIALWKMGQGAMIIGPGLERVLLYGVPAFAILVLLPSSTVSWLAVALFALALSATGRDNLRFGAALFLGVALSALWLNFGAKLLIEPLTTLDAIITQHTLGLIGIHATRSGNILTQDSGFSVIVLADCSTWKGLPLEILSFIAVSTFAGANLKARRFWISAALVTASMVLANIIRLVLISLTPELHAALHGDEGKNLYDFARMMIIFVTAFWMIP